MSSARSLTLAAAGLATVAAGAAVTAVALSPSVGEVTYLALILLAAGGSITLALLVSRRLPRHPVGPLMAANGLVALILAGDVYTAAAERRPDLLPLPSPSTSEATSGSWMLLYLPLTLLLLLFPDGRLPGPRWRVVAFALPAVAVVFNALIVVGAVWPATRASMVGLATPLPVVLMALLLASGASVFVRYQRSDALTRSKLRWLVLAGTTVPLTLLLCWASYLLLKTPDLVVVGLLVMYLAVPAAAAFALLRADRVDIDDVLVSTTTYLVVGVGLLGVLSVASAATGLLVARWSTPAAIVVTVACTLLVPAARRRLQRVLGRWLYADRARALAAVEVLRAAVHSGSAPPEDVQRVLREGLRDPDLVVAARPLGGGPLLRLDDGTPLRQPPYAGWRAPGTPDLTAPIRLGEEEIGVIVPGPRATRRPPAEVAQAAGFLVELARLRGELTRALDQVDASRARILRAGYEERRRLERDLHDGAQQRLVSLGLALRVLQRTDPEAAGLTGALDAAVAEIGTAVSELRQIAHGLRPSSLDDGLGPALAQLVRLCPTPVEVTMEAGELPDAVTTTAYFVASEAVTNAVRHAEAERIAVGIAREGADLRIRVVDDGQGGAVVRPGAGLAGLRDRVSALGGRLSVGDGEPGGTVVEVVLPCRA